MPDFIGSAFAGQIKTHKLQSSGRNSHGKCAPIAKHSTHPYIQAYGHDVHGCTVKDPSSRLGLYSPCSECFRSRADW